jgi:hypothetical protein
VRPKLIKSFVTTPTYLSLAVMREYKTEATTAKPIVTAGSSIAQLKIRAAFIKTQLAVGCPE